MTGRQEQTTDGFTIADQFTIAPQQLDTNFCAKMHLPAMRLNVPMQIALLEPGLAQATTLFPNLWGPQFMINKKLVPVLVGQLLVESGMLERELLDIALERARQNNVKIGQILLYSGLVSDSHLKAALTAQRMLRQSFISYRQAVEALVLVRKDEMPYESALARARWLHTSEQMHFFARLLIDAGVVTESDIGSCLALSIKQNYPLGKVLMLHEKISLEARHAAIDAIILSRSGEITYHHAIAALRAVVRKQTTIANLLCLEDSPMNLLSKDLIQSGVLSPFEVLDIIEESLQKETLWNGITVGPTLIASLKFAASLSINRMVTNGEISMKRAQTLCRDLLLSTASVLRNLKNVSPDVLVPSTAAAS